MECRGGFRKKKKTHKPDNYLQTSFIIQEYNDLNKTLLCKHVNTETSEIANSSGLNLVKELENRESIVIHIDKASS